MTLSIPTQILRVVGIKSTAHDVASKTERLGSAYIARCSSPGYFYLSERKNIERDREKQHIQSIGDGRLWRNCLFIAISSSSI